jgi:hypothetical protein
MEAVGIISAGMSIVSGLRSINEGQRQAEAMRMQGMLQNQQYQTQAMQYRMQAAQMQQQGQMALIQAQERSLNYRREELNAKRQANNILERLARANGAAIARAAAMNIQPFSGSPLDLQKYNDREAGKEWEIAAENATTSKDAASRALKWGELQKGEYDIGALSAFYAGDIAIGTGSMAEASANSAVQKIKDDALWKGIMSIGEGVVGFGRLGGPPSAPRNYLGTTTSSGTGFRFSDGYVGLRPSNGYVGMRF